MICLELFGLSSVTSGREKAIEIARNGISGQWRAANDLKTLALR